MKQLMLKLINLYQQTLSRDRGWNLIRYPGGYCKYIPHCSEYCKRSIDKRGLIYGGIASIWRVLRCNPWSEGGIDLP
ncbi:MAG: membrane protein insertion efficiency factor YidD [Patescibacteria group bacterium]